MDWGGLGLRWRGYNMGKGTVVAVGTPGCQGFQQHMHPARIPCAGMERWWVHGRTHGPPAQPGWEDGLGHKGVSRAGAAPPPTPRQMWPQPVGGQPGTHRGSLAPWHRQEAVPCAYRQPRGCLPLPDSPAGHGWFGSSCARGPAPAHWGLPAATRASCWGLAGPAAPPALLPRLGLCQC